MNQFVLRKSSDCMKESAEWGELTWHASGAMGNAQALTLGRCVLRPGCANPRHSHPNCEEVLHVLRGKIIHSLGEGSAVEMSEGDTVTIASGTAHNARNVESEDAVLLICFSSADRQTAGE